MLNSFAYHHSPIWAQESIIAMKSAVRNLLREGRTFSTHAAEVDQTQWWSPSALLEFQRAQLRQLLAAAAAVPWHRQRLQGAGIDPASVELPADLPRLPMMTREDVRANGTALLSTARTGPLFSGSTSGTSGTPLSLYQDLHAINRENAFIWRQLTWAGLRRGERRAWMRGDMIVPAAQKQPPYWRFNRAENMLMLSSYHLSEAAAASYVDALAGFDPVVIQAYPSSIAFLAAWMAGGDRTYAGRSLKGIVTSSETLTPEMRGEIEQAFGCRVFDWYGQGERVAAIGTCEHGRHHLMTDYGFVELIPGDGASGLHELVGTGFNNRAMPLLRYRCGDYVRPAPAGARCECGRAFPLIEAIVGRNDDAVKLPDGRSIGRLDHVFKGLSGILEAQIRQDAPDAVDILVVPGSGFDERMRERLLANARERLGPDIALAVHVVDAVPRTRNGKLKGVVCNV